MTDDNATTSADNQRKLLIVGGLVLLLLALGGVYLVWARGRVSNDLADREARAQVVIEEFEASQAENATPTAAIAQPTAEPAEAAPSGPVPKPGEVVVVNRAPGDDYGRLAIRHADGSRTLLERTCVRVHIAADRGVCLSENGGLAGGYKTTFFDTAAPNIALKSYSSALPSRARISPDGTWSSVTAFITGASYEDISVGSSTIVTIDEIDEQNRLVGATQFSVDDDEDKYSSFQAQYWGMTFADTGEFYITGFYGDVPEIMHGSMDSLTLTPTGWQGSCPSLSPDGKTLVFKQVRDGGGFDLMAVDLASQTNWLINETRSVDDQVEWLDNDTILYALHPEGGDKPVQPEFDIWMINIAEGSEPELFLPNADSPAVARG